MAYYISRTNSSEYSQQESPRFITPNIVTMPPGSDQKTPRRRDSHLASSLELSLNDSQAGLEIQSKKGPEVVNNADSAFMMNFKHLNLQSLLNQLSPADARNSPYAYQYEKELISKLMSELRQEDDTIEQLGSDRQLATKDSENQLSQLGSERQAPLKVNRRLTHKSRPNDLLDEEHSLTLEFDQEEQNYHTNLYKSNTRVQIEQYAMKLGKYGKMETKALEQRRKCKSWMFFLAQIFMALLNILAVIIYIIADYEGNNEPMWILWMELSITFFFIIEFIWYISRSIMYLFSFQAVVDIATIVPPILQIPLNSQGNLFGYLRILRLVKAFRVIRLFKYLNKKRNSNDGNFEYDSESQDDKEEAFEFSEFRRQLLRRMLWLFIALFIGAGFIIFTQTLGGGFAAENQQLRFFDAFYYVVITVGSIGYGDYFPRDEGGRVSIIVIVVTLLFIFTYTITGIVRIITETDLYDILFNFKNHIVVAGQTDPQTLFRFLHRFYTMQQHIQREGKCCRRPVVTKCIVMGQKPIDLMMKQILFWPLFQGRVYYLSTKPIDARLIKKASLKQASAIFYITEQYATGNPSVEDKNAHFFVKFLEKNRIFSNVFVMFQESIEVFHNKKAKTDQYMSENNFSLSKKYGAYCCKSLPFNRLHSREVSELRDRQIRQQRFSFQLLEAKFTALATATFNDGFIPFIHSLLIGDSSLYRLSKDYISPSIFARSMKFQLYTCHLPKCVVGLTFPEAVRTIGLTDSALLLLGVVEVHPLTGKTEKLYLNPLNYVMKPGDLGFFLSEQPNQQISERFLRGMDVYFPYKLKMNRTKTGLGAQKPIEVQRVALAPNFLRRGKLLESIINPTEREHKLFKEHPLLNKIMMHYAKYHCFSNYLKNTQINLSKDTLENIMVGHIIICGYSKGVSFFIENIREHSQVPVCILNDSQPSLSIVKLMSVHSKVYYLRGSSMNAYHLRNAAINSCHCVIILHQDPEGSAFSDSCSVMSSRLIHQISPGTKVIQEIKHPNSLEFLEATPLKVQWDLDYQFWPLFMSGNVFQSSLLENMMPFASMKPELAIFLGKFFKLEDISEKLNIKKQFSSTQTTGSVSSKVLTPKSRFSAPMSFKPYFPSRSRNANLMTKSTTQQCSGKEEIKQEDTVQEQSNFVVNTTSALREDEDKTKIGLSLRVSTFEDIEQIIEQKELLTIDIPQEYHNEQYYELFCQILSITPAFIPIGLLRNQQGFKKHYMGFPNQINLEQILTPVFITNPSKQTMIRPCDRLLVLGRYTPESQLQYLHLNRQVVANALIDRRHHIQNLEQEMQIKQDLLFKNSRKKLSKLVDILDKRVNSIKDLQKKIADNNLNIIFQKSRASQRRKPATSHIKVY